MFLRNFTGILLAFIGLAAAQTTLSPGNCFNPIIQQLGQYAADIVEEIDEFELIVDDSTISNRFNATREAVKLIVERSANLTLAKDVMERSGPLFTRLFQILSDVGMLVNRFLNLLRDILDAIELGGLNPEALLKITGIYNLIEAARQYIQSSDVTLRTCLISFLFSELRRPYADWFLQLNNTLMAQFPDPEMQKLTQKFGEALPDIITADELDLAPCRLGMKKVFVHGDLWSANMMWDEEGKLKKLIDFQMIHFGLAATDLARVFNTCLTPEDRHKNRDRYLEHYYKCLEKHCKEAEKEVPFDLEQLTTTYQLAYPRVSAYLLPALTAVLEKVVTMPDIPAKPIILGSFIAKVKGIYQDIIDYHENRPEI